jgi:hypothetical protein
VLLAVDPDEDFIDVEGVAIASVFSYKAARVNSTELDTPQAYRLSADCDTSFSEGIFDIAMTEVESVVEPDGVADDVGRESVALISIHELILPKPAL